MSGTISDILRHYQSYDPNIDPDPLLPVTPTDQLFVVALEIWRVRIRLLGFGIPEEQVDLILSLATHRHGALTEVEKTMLPRLREEQI